MQPSELFVTGKDTVCIRLKRKPSFIVVKFIDSDCIIPCSPHQYDFLEWEVVTENKLCKKKYFLVINWDVTGVRKIAWEVFY